MPNRWLCVALCGLTWTTATAHAQEVELAWQAPSECPDAQWLRDRVAEMLADSEVTGASMRADGVIRSSGDGYVMQLSIEQQGRRAARTLHDTDCANLSEAAAFLLAVAIDPGLPPPPPPKSVPASDAAATEPAADDEPTADAEPMAEPPPSAPPETAPIPAAISDVAGGPTSSGAPLGLLAGAFGSVLATGLAGPHLGLGALLGLGVGDTTLALDFAHHFARLRTLDANAHSRFELQILSLTACRHFGALLRLGGCARVSGLRTHGSIEGISRPEQADAYWATGAASLVVGLRATEALTLYLDAGPWAALTPRPRFEVDGLGQVGEGAAFGACARLGATWQWP